LDAESVVADEVRNLAQRAAQSARDTAILIEESAARAHEGREQVERVTGAIAHFTTSVGQVQAIASSVSTASQQQAQGVLQVPTAIQEMQKLTQTTAATAEENAAASEELSAQAETTLQLIEQLEDAIGRAGAKPTVRRRSHPGAKPATLVPPPQKRTVPAIPVRKERGTGTYPAF
jgi:methyl-accepting chemotaxis protein